MDAPLIDPEGYPRNDIDVHKVRSARHSVICLRNDLKAVMKEIEEGLHNLHSQSRESVGEAAVRELNIQALEASVREAFARVDRVDEGSPAFEAGMRASDELAVFGSINAENFASMRSLSEVTYNSKGSALQVVVVRGPSNARKEKTLKLVPRSWSGKGLLGCNIVPLETDVDR